MLEFVAIALVLLAICLAWSGLSSLTAGSRSASWPVIRGRVVASAIIRKTNSDDNEVWRPVVEYEYSVGGRSYHGTRIRFGIPASLVWLEPADPLFRQLQRGADIEIRYSPARPSRSTLRATASPFVYITLAAAAASGWLGWSLILAWQ